MWAAMPWTTQEQFCQDYYIINTAVIKTILLADEYFAEGLMSYFDVQYPYDPAAPATREQLYSMDPMFYSFIDRWMYHNEWRGGCP